jgi:RNA polymerase sigma-70 factor (ECF subfamily)
VDRLTGYLVAARDGDDLALTAAIRAGQPEVRRFLRLLVDTADLDDVVQDTFIRAYRALPRFRGESTGRTWLLAIARRAAADATRGRIRQRRLRQRTEHVAAGGTAADPGDEHALADLVAGLEPERREAFVLTQLVGCPYLEAAEICGVPVGTIRSRVARAREQLLEQVHAARSA